MSDNCIRYATARIRLQVVAVAVAVAAVVAAAAAAVVVVVTIAAAARAERRRSHPPKNVTCSTCSHLCPATKCFGRRRVRAGDKRR